MGKIKLAGRLASFNESATLALNARAKQLAADGKTIYNLTAGEPAGDTPDYIQTAVAKTLDRNKYTPAAGLPELRAAIAEHARQFYGLSWIKAANVVVTASTKPALYGSLMALLNENDEVIVPTPAWGSHLDLVKLAGGKAITVPLTAEYDLDVSAIEAKLSSRTKAILVNSPHNPTGAVFSDQAVKALALLANQKDLYVIADDIYTKLVFDNNFKPVPKFGFENLIIAGGFSKSQAITGWRIGYLIAKKPIAEAVTGLLSHITGNAPLPSQYAALAALERHDKPPAATLAALKKHRAIVLKGLNEAGIKHNQPGGAFYVFLDLRDLTDNSAAWCERLLNETGVALVPGEAFEAPGFARLTFVADEQILKTALREIKKFAKADK